MKNKLLFSLSCFALCLLLVGFAVGVHGQALPGTGTLASGSTTPPYATINGTVIGPVFALTAPPLTGWTVENSATLSTSNGYIYLTGTSTGATTVRDIYRTAPASTPWTKTFVFDVDISGGPTGGGEITFGPIFRQNSTGKIIQWSNGWGFSSQALNGVNYFNSATSYNSTPQSTHATSNSTMAWATRRFHIMKIEDDGTSLNFYSSLTGNSGEFALAWTMARGAFMTGGPDQYGIATYSNASGTVQVVCYSIQ